MSVMKTWHVETKSGTHAVIHATRVIFDDEIGYVTFYDDKKCEVVGYFYKPAAVRQP